MIALVGHLLRKLNLMWREIYHEFRRWAKVSERAVAAYQRTEIIMETDRVFIIRKSHSTRGWCAECGREVVLVGVKEVEVLRGKAQLFTTHPMLPGCGDSRGLHWSLASKGLLTADNTAGNPRRTGSKGLAAIILLARPTV